MFSTKRIAWILIAIVIIGAGLRFWNLTGPDMVGDDALYSFRSVGYVDYVAAVNRQSTPVTWFSEAQWWQTLSFHDAPPLVFAVQWVFFKIFGASLFAARLPFVLVGLLSIFFLFLLGKRLAGEWVGLIAAGVMALTSYHIWVSRIGLLDGFVVLWIILSLYFFVRAREKSLYYLFWGIAVGLGLLTKYTFLFMGPVFLIAFLWWRRDAWKQKWFYLGLVALIIVITPVIIYNTMMWQTRGHLDAALSTMIGEQPEDFKGLTREIKSEGRVVETTGQIGKNFSVGFQALALASIIIVIFSLVRRREDSQGDDKKSDMHLVWLGLLFAFVMLVFSGSTERLAAVIIPFVGLFIAVGLYQAWQIGQKTVRASLLILVVVLLGWEAIFVIQNQLTPTPFLKQSLFLDHDRQRWDGYNELETYVGEFYETFPPAKHIIFNEEPQLAAYQSKWIAARYPNGVGESQSNQLLVYDDRMDWTPAVWIFERRRLYDSLPAPSLSRFLSKVSEAGVAYYTSSGFEEMALIIPTENITSDYDAITIPGEFIDSFVEGITSATEPTDTIRRYDGEIIFEIYRVALES